MSATLYREGSDLDELLAELDAQHGGPVKVVEIDYGRDGGVMGFFAHRRVRVHYVVNDEVVNGDADVAGAGIPVPATAAPADSPLEELLRAADAAEMIESGRAPATPAPVDGPHENIEFARMLLEMAGQKAAERATRAAAETPLSATPPTSTILPAAAQPPAPRIAAFLTATPSAELPPTAAQPRTFEVQRMDDARPLAIHTVARASEPLPVGGRHRAESEPPPAPRRTDPQPETAGDVTHVARRPAPVPRQQLPRSLEAAPARSAADSFVESPALARNTPTRTSYTLRRQLAELGVPVDRIPEHDNAFLVIEHLVRQAPTAPEVDPEPGHLVVIAGPARHVLVEATRLCTRLRLDPARLHKAGFGDSPIAHRRDAVALAHRVRADASEICVIAIATDATGAEADASGRDDLAWAASLVTALAPDHLVVVVDATSKPADARSMLAAVGPAAAIAVVGAGRTASPASLWELGVGVMSLDGRPATRGAWAALLIDRLTDLDLV